MWLLHRCRRPASDPADPSVRPLILPKPRTPTSFLDHEVAQSQRRLRGLRTYNSWAYYCMAVAVVPLFVVFYVSLYGGMPFWIPRSKSMVVDPQPGAKVGFLLHVFPGALYMILAALLFSSSLRRGAPNLHHKLGYAYYICIVIAIVGMLVINVGGFEAGWSSVAAAMTVGIPLWGWCHAQAFLYIKRGDVARHREYNIRGMALSVGLVVMRPLVWVVEAIGLEDDRVVALKIVTWMVWMWAILLTEVYLAVERNAQQLSGQLSPMGLLEVDARSFRGPIPLLFASRQSLNSRTTIFRFQLPMGYVLRVLPGQHVSISTEIEGKWVTRSYTPVTAPQDAEAGWLELLIRLRPEGRVTPHLFSLTAPTSSYKLVAIHESRGFRYVPSPLEHQRVVLLAGGTGLSSFLSLLMAALQSHHDATHFTLFFLNRTEEEVFFRDVLEGLQERSNGRLEVQYIFTQTDSWVEEQLVGAIKAISQQQPVQMLVSGPTGLLMAAREAILQEPREVLKEEDAFFFGYSDR